MNLLAKISFSVIMDNKGDKSHYTVSSSNYIIPETPSDLFS